MPSRQESISEDMLYSRNRVAKEYGAKGQITGKRKTKKRNRPESRNEIENKTRNVFSICC